MFARAPPPPPLNGPFPQVDSHGLDAFDSPNYAPLVRLATGFRVNFAAFRPQPKGRFRIST